MASSRIVCVELYLSLSNVLSTKFSFDKAVFYTVNLQIDLPAPQLLSQCTDPSGRGPRWMAKRSFALMSVTFNGPKLSHNKEEES